MSITIKIHHKYYLLVRPLVPANEEKVLRNLSDKERTAKLDAMLPPEAPCPPWSNMMNWDNLKQLTKQGFELGAHTVTHLSLGHDKARTP